MTGTRPVIDFMFVDFLNDAFGEVANQIAKMQYMSGGRLKMPVLLRGGRRRDFERGGLRDDCPAGERAGVGSGLRSAGVGGADGHRLAGQRAFDEDHLATRVRDAAASPGARAAKTGGLDHAVRALGRALWWSARQRSPRAPGR